MSQALNASRTAIRRRPPFSRGLTDKECILKVQRSCWMRSPLGLLTNPVGVATANPGHLSRFVYRSTMVGQHRPDLCYIEAGHEPGAGTSPVLPKWNRLGAETPGASLEVNSSWKLAAILSLAIPVRIVSDL